ncbi:MAG: restriction endonuclease subunit S [Nitrospirales bacterium]|nr:restriction endonuclease subunit S [Nitrospirales bacterium]
MKNGWQTRKLGEVCSFLNRGISPKYIEDGGICVLNQKCIREHRVSYEPARRHDGQAKRVSSDRLIHAGDVLVNSTGTGTLGRVAQVRGNPPEPTTVDSHVTIVRPKPGKFHLEFFGYMLVVIEDAIKEAGEGCGGQTELARSVLAEKFSVHYPESLSEQQRIVGILDETFKGIAAAKANAEKNLQNSRALFDSHLHSVFTHRGEGWVERKLGDVCEYLNGKAHEQYIVEDGPFIVINSKFISSEGKVFKRSNKALLLLHPGDIAMVLSDVPKGKALAKCFLVEKTDTFTLNQRICLIRSNKFHTKFLFYQLNRNRHFLALDNGENQTNMRLNQVLSCPLFLPSTPEQETIAAKLDALNEETQRLESIYQQKLAALESLKKSLLHQAFTGALK